MKLSFTKMQGCANDYIYLDCRTSGVPENIAALSERLSRRHFSIGADGIICICAPVTAGADAMMRIFNADGSEGKMCGNGIRCVGKYVYEHGLTRKTTLTIETGSGNRVIHLQTRENLNEICQVTVEMGTPEFRAAQIPVVSLGEYVLEHKITVCGENYTMTCLSMGNPHAVIFSEEINGISLEETGRELEFHPRFPERANIEFCHVTARDRMEIRVWERGVGETLACGTGACAAAVAAMLSGCVSEGETAVELRGGRLFVTWDRTKNKVLLTGPAETVFEGTLAERI